MKFAAPLYEQIEVWNRGSEVLGDPDKLLEKLSMTAYVFGVKCSPLGREVTVRILAADLTTATRKLQRMYPKVDVTRILESSVQSAH